MPICPFPYSPIQSYKGKYGGLYMRSDLNKSKSQMHIDYVFSFASLLFVFFVLF